MKHSYLQFRRSAFLFLIASALFGKVNAQSDSLRSARTDGTQSVNGTVTYDGTGAGTGGSEGSYFGNNAGRVTTGNYNSFFGSNSGYDNTLGQGNSFIGASAGRRNTAGNFNTNIGYVGGNYNTTGNNNVNIGAFAGAANVTGNGNVLIGFSAGRYEMGSNKLYIANSDTINPLVHGDFATKRLIMNGKVGISTSMFPTSVGGANVSGYQLFVKGGILTDEVRVRTGWADYVFDQNYKLNTLTQVESFIKENGHLPNTPSAREVEVQGLSLGEIARIQQEKIEELTLYLINQEKRIHSYSERFKSQQNQIDELRALISNSQREN